MNSEQDRKFFYNYSLVIGVLILFLLLCLVLARYIGMDADAGAQEQAANIPGATLTPPAA